MTVSTAVPADAVARVLGIKTEFKELRAGNILFLPQRLAVVGQGNTTASYPTTKLEVTTAAQVAQVYGSGSPLHLAALELLPVNGDGVLNTPVTIYPLVDDAAGVAAIGDITPSGVPSGAASFVVRVNNIDSVPFLVANGDLVAVIVTAITAAINASVDLPITAVDGVTKVDITSKWEGVSANGILVSIIGTTGAGVSFAITQPTGGATNPDVQDALDLVGEVWETMFLNLMEAADTVTLDKYSVFGESRWSALTKKPMVAFAGDVTASVTTSITVPDARPTDRVNVQLTSPGSLELPFVVAARMLSRIVRLASANPPHDYGSQSATGLVPGPDSDQWNYTERDIAVKAGTSTSEVKDGVVNVSDTVTMFHPANDPIPAYRFVVDIVKLQNIIFNLDLIFATPEWDGAPLIPDGQPTSNPAAKHPSAAVAAIASMLDALALSAIISDPDAAKKTIVAVINTGNPKRLDIAFTVQLSGNTNIISIDFNFGFFFGEAFVVST